MNFLITPSLHKQACSPFDSDVLSRLRVATKAQHQILDKTMPLAKVDASWCDYVEHLQLLAAWLIPLEQWLCRFNDGPQVQDLFPFVRYSDFIKRDLGEAYALQQSATQRVDWSQHQDSAYRWGVSYVIEGSQLGGEFLYKRLATRLAPHPLSYLQRKHEGRWTAFLHGLAQEVTTEEHISRACEGAVDAFDALLKELRARD